MIDSESPVFEYLFSIYYLWDLKKVLTPEPPFISVDFLL